MKGIATGLFILMVTSWLLPSGASAAPRSSSEWKDYRHFKLKFQMKVPRTWFKRNSANAVGFTSTKDGTGGAIGVLRHLGKNLRIDQIAAEHYRRESRPKGWVQAGVALDGKRALRIALAPARPGLKRMLYYYVQVSNGYYLIQCMAPDKDWARYEPSFLYMIRSFKSFP